MDFRTFSLNLGSNYHVLGIDYPFTNYADKYYFFFCN